MLIFTKSLYATTEAEEKIMVSKVLKKYTETVACGAVFDSRNIFTMRRDPEYGGATYYVLWSGDMGCYSGSGTYSFYVSKISRAMGSRPFLVMNDDAFGKAFSGINSRFIESIKQFSSSHFEIIASKFAKGDANCCPSLKYRYILSRLEQFGEWVIRSEKRLK